MSNRIYIESSIPSFYFTERKSPDAIARKNWTRQWWEEYSSHFTLLTSTAVIYELRQGKNNITVDRINLLKDIELLEITPIPVGMNIAMKNSITLWPVHQKVLPANF
jgi:hypothetical protein